MSLDDLANVGEFVGAIGVVISLLYLARQIGQNTRAVWLSAYDRYGAAGANVRRTIIENAETARIYAIGLRDPETLDEIEEVRFRVLMLDLLQAFQIQYAQLGASGLGTDEWQATCQTLRRVVAQPGFQAFWSAHRSEFPPSFAREIERLSTSD